jgi:SAM-dependent methyltransferase
MTDPRAEVVRSGYAGVARAYREQLSGELAGKPLDRAFLDAFVERCGRGRVVDLGCGPGHVAQYLASRGATVEGLDLSPHMIEQATASWPDIPFRVGDMFELPYGAETISGIVAFYAIVHLRTDELITPFREVHRVLAPGGLVAIAFHVGSDIVHIDELFGQKTSLDFMFHRPEAVIAALRDVGFTLEARLDREPYPGAEHASQRAYLLARK